MQKQDHTSRPISREIIELYDEYTHAPLPRRDFIQRLAMITGSVSAAYAVLPFLENNYAQAQIVPANDDRLVTGKVTYPAGQGQQGTVHAYQVYPKNASGKLPAVVVIHENRGLNPHIEDVARRLALEGYLVIAPDFLSLDGGTPTDEDQARAMFSKLDMKKALIIGEASVRYLKQNQRGTGKVGVVGFCWGGGMTNQLAVNVPDLDAAVAYYGPQPKSPEEIARIKAPLLLHYGGLDKNINPGIPAYEKELKAHHKEYQVYIYEGADHGFNNDTGAARYNEAAAKLAWSRTVDFLNKHLGSA
ncbi:dienelactone hydrolase family protein [Uliginosibacterium sp. sgz301328]|uniref:dienelactone hydrolase family protein n=1 Tax=Uliginosibacterium sp. sgz301328 TaxID=3243764 RepID=UPI00359DC49E